eukprot:m51a1_g10828 putative protein tyrosine phosphatase (172) ;mRNA; f:30439-31539
MSSAGSLLPNPPSLVASGRLRFLVFDTPVDELMDSYIQELQRYGVKHIVCACDVSYDKTALERAGFVHHTMTFTDGAAPPDDVIDRWLDLVFEVFGNDKSAARSNECIGVHCAAGLGRAPALVTIALIEGGMHPLEAVDQVRKKCRGAINTPQLQFFKGYKRRRHKSCCIC